MSRKMDLAIAVAGLVAAYLGLVASYGAWWFPVAASQPTATVEVAESNGFLLDRLRPNSVLRVSGTGVNVTIRKGPADIRYDGGEVSSTGEDRVIYLPLGQPLELKITGTGADVLVEAELMPYIRVNNTAVGATVHSLRRDMQPVRDGEVPFIR